MNPSLWFKVLKTPSFVGMRFSATKRFQSSERQSLFPWRSCVHHLPTWPLGCGRRWPTMRRTRSWCWFWCWSWCCRCWRRCCRCWRCWRWRCWCGLYSRASCAAAGAAAAGAGAAGAAAGVCALWEFWFYQLPSRLQRRASCAAEREESWLCAFIAGRNHTILSAIAQACLIKVSAIFGALKTHFSSKWVPDRH